MAGAIGDCKEKLLPEIGKVDRKPLLVTGATGFLGMHFVRALMQAQWFPTLLFRDPRKLNDIYPSYPGDKILWDLTSPGDGELVGKIAHAAVAVHAAGKVEGGSSFDAACSILSVNIVSGLNLIRALPPTCNHIILLSSTSVYGDPETDCIDEQHPTNPADFYGVSKLTVEKFFRLYGREQNKTVTILRISSVYGPGMPESRAIPRFIRAIIKGEPLTFTPSALAARNYIYVSDVIRAILLSVMAGKAVDGVFNIAAEKSICLTEIVDIIESLVGRRASRRLAEQAFGHAVSPRNYNVSKAKEVLGFEERVPISEGVSAILQKMGGRIETGCEPRGS